MTQPAYVRRNRAHRASLLGFTTAGIVLGLALLATPLGASSPVGNHAPPAAGRIAAAIPGVTGYEVRNPYPNSVTGMSFYWNQPTVSCNATQTDQQDFLLFAIIANLNWTDHTGFGTWGYCKVGSSTPTYIAVFTQQANVKCPHHYDGCIIRALHVMPGDLFAGSMTWSVATMNMTLSVQDLTHRQSWSKVTHVPALYPNDALCGQYQFTDLAQFSPVHRGCGATINGTTRPIGMFGSPNILVKDTKVSPGGGASLMRVSSLYLLKSSFTVTWLKSEPS